MQNTLEGMISRLNDTEEQIMSWKTGSGSNWKETGQKKKKKKRWQFKRPLGFPRSSAGKESAYNAGDLD